MSGSRTGDGTDERSRTTPLATSLSDEHVEALRVRLRKAVSRACPGWFGDHQEDIVQNALVQLVKTCRQGDGNRELSSIYLGKVAHGAAVDEIRRWCRRREVQQRSDEMMEETPSRRADPEGETAGREIGRAIRECMGSLVRPRQLAVMLYLQGCSVPEAARRLHWTVTKTENLVYRGLGNLRRCLAAKRMTP